MPRDFDIILYGATGFTGRQTVAYFKQHAPSTLKWAIAGRDRARLDALNANVPILTAGSSDQPSIDSIVARTRVLLSTAGPFAIYGTGLVDACVRFQTHYADITGETHWVRMLIDRYHEKAAADGTRILPCCGFDSVPSDLGAMLIAHTLGPETREVKAFFKMKGGLNGGTLASMLNMYESGADKTMNDPFLLSPSVSRAPRDLELDPTKEAYDPDAKAWTAPFLMSKINTRVVRRSCAMRGLDFAYQEYTKIDGSLAGPLALAMAAGGSVRPRDGISHHAPRPPHRFPRARRRPVPTHHGHRLVPLRIFRKSLRRPNGPVRSKRPGRSRKPRHHKMSLRIGPGSGAR